jgi:glycerol-3-phosphate acyltransferase PlsY
MLPVLLLTAVAAYLCGSLPSGLLVGRARGVDIRALGSGNIGATNVFRTVGKGWGVLTFLADAGKGVLAVSLGFFLAGKFAPGLNPAVAGIAAAVCCILGHNFPVWLKFKGGKGVATSLGVVIGLVPLAAAIGLGVWVLAMLLTRYVSVASIAGAVAVPVAVALRSASPDKMPLLVFSIVAALLIVVRHKANIRRLLAGTEHRFGKKKP